MNKEEIIVSAEVKTYLMDLYNQIEYELQEQYNDEVQKLQQENEELQQRINKAIEYIENQIPIVKNEINIPNINTATSELLNYEQLLEILKGGNDE